MSDPQDYPSNARDLVTISAGFFFAFLGAGSSQPFVISYLSEEKGLSLSQSSLVLSTIYFTIVVSRFAIGYIVEVTGLHGAKILGMLTYALFPFIVYGSGSFPVLMGGSILWGIGAAMLWTGGLVQIMNVSPPTRHGTATGIVRGCVMVALFIGSYLLAFIYARRGYEALFLAAAAIGVAGIGSILVSPKREVPIEKPELRKFFTVMGSHEAKVIGVFMLCSGLAYGIVLNGLKTLIEEDFGKYWLELILPVFSISAILSSFIGGWISDRTDRWKSFAWGFAIGAVGMLSAWVSKSPAIMMFAMLLIGVQFAFIPVMGITWIGDQSNPSDRAAIMGFIFSFRDLGVALAIQMRGYIPDTRTALFLFAVISIVCAGVAWAIGHAVPRIPSQYKRAGEAG